MKSIASRSPLDKPSPAAVRGPSGIVAGAAAAGVVMRWLLPAALIVALILTAALWMAGPESPGGDPAYEAREPGAPHAARPEAPRPEAPAGSSTAMRDLEKQRREATRAVEPGPQSNAAEVEAFQLALADRIKARRRDAQRGDLLDPPMVAYMTDVTRAILEGERGAQILETLRENNPDGDPEAGPAPPELAINATYPEDVALSMVPPSLLALYPPPPEGIEYRFVGCRLILMDRDARLILDYTEECLW